jgi:hypothetical protein
VAWRPVQGALPGFLSLLGLKNLGQNPAELREDIQPTIDLKGFLLEGDALNFARTNQTVNVLAQGGQYGHAVVVPDGELWWVHHATVIANSPAAATVINIHALQVVCVMPLPNTELRGEPLTLNIAAPTAADASCAFAPPSLRGFWAPAGSTIFGAGSIDIEDAGGVLFSFHVDVRYTPVQV